MGGLIILLFIYIAGVIIGAFVSNPDLDYHAEEKTASYFRGLHIVMGILFLFVIMASVQ